MYPCVICKGRDCKKYFGTDFCPLKTKLRAYIQTKEISTKLGKEFTTKVPGTFISRFGYPNISLGVTHSIINSDLAFLPNTSISKMKIPMQNVIDSRMGILSLQRKGSVKTIDSNALVVQHVALSKKNPDIDVSLASAPKFSFSVEPNAAPFGGRADLKKLSETENIALDPYASKAYYDTDLKSIDAISMLSKNFDEQRISEMLSAGTLGIGSRRKLVPTRWSITATDDSLGKNIIDKIIHYEKTDNPMAFIGSYFGNYYYILLLPGVFSFELFENYMPTNSVMHDFELVNRRTSYAYDTAGGYYATRLAVLQYLERINKQAIVIAFRLISKEYNTPLGVWVVREAVRNAMQNQPITFDNKEIMLKFFLAHVKKHHDFNVQDMIKSSVIFDFLKKQRTLSDFK